MGEESKKQTLITVFTPTYQRASTLHRVYSGLLNQDIDKEDIEWVVVDDGSTDNTRHIIDGYTSEAYINIRYFYQENGGKHRAWNKGVREARGELFAFIDSDDSCTPNALTLIRDTWYSIEYEDRNALSGLLSSCKYSNDKIIGESVLESGSIIDFPSLVLCGGATWDMWHIPRVDMLKRHLFPEGPKGRLVPESTLWYSMRKKWLVIDDPIKVVYSGDDGRDDQLSKVTSLESIAPGQVLNYTSMLSNVSDLFWCNPLAFVKAAAQVSRFSVLSQKRIRDSLEKVSDTSMRALCYIVAPVGYAVAVLDQLRKR